MANAYTNDVHEFWGDRAWPDDDQIRGFTFLARAALDIGQALFRDEWLGSEPYLSLPPRALPKLPSVPLRLTTFPRSAPPSEPPAARAEDAIAAPDGPWWRSEYLGAGLALPEPKTIERDEAAERMLTEARLRWDEVMRATVFFLNSKRLQASWRGLYGGAFFDIPDTDWNTESLIAQRRFVLCRMHPQQAFTGPLDGPVFIYVSTASLRTLLAELNACHPSNQAIEAPTPADDSGHDVQLDAPRYAEFRAALIAKMQDDPDRAKPENRHLDKAGVRRWAKTEFGLSFDHTDAERSVIMRSVEFAHGWNKGGRPRKTVGQ